jgi:WD40 repeat protein/tRNA A-37 threonylcarbamoyl transferase component Bud32
MNADRNLLFGVLALKARLIDAQRFAAACAAWAGHRDASLAELLVGRGWISADDRAGLERQLVQTLTQHGGDARASLAAAADEHLVDLLATVPETDTRPPAGGATATSAEPHPRYTLLRLHARGGIGQVWLARDADLGREVALKELRPDRADSADARDRFLKEAQVTGQLEHPGIVPVYEVGRRGEDDQPFYAMRMVNGQTLSEAIKEHHRQRRAGAADALERRKLLGAFVTVCQAVAYAHSRGVLHRDLKPHNVVLGNFGEVILLDWGLAKVTREADQATPVVADDATEETRCGSVLGTPAYMAPEQAEGRVERVDARSDVYGLGAILFEILTGEAPFRGPDAADILRQVRACAAPRPRRVNPTVPPALDAVCSRALAREPADRYAAATDLADEVNRFLADEPVRAWPEPLTVWLGRVARRNLPAVTAVAALLLASVVALSLSTYLIRKEMTRTDQARLRADANFAEAREQQHQAEVNARAARTQEEAARTQARVAEQRRRQAVAEAERARRSMYAAQLSQAALLAERDPLQAVALLEDPQRCPPDLRDFTWRLLYASCRRDRFSVPGPATLALRNGYSPIWEYVAFPDADTLVTMAEEKGAVGVRGFDLATGAPRYTLELPARPVVAADGRGLAVLAPGKQLSVHELSSGRLLVRHELREHEGTVLAYALSDDLTTLATAGPGPVLSLWDVRGGRRLRRLEGLKGPVTQLAFTPGGKALVSVERTDAGAVQARTLQLWDVTAGDRPRTLPGTFKDVQRLTPSPDGRRLALWDAVGKAVALYDLAGGEALPLPQNDSYQPQLLQFTPDGRSLVLVSRNAGFVRGKATTSNTIQAWDVGAAAPRLLFRQTAFDAGATLSPDGRTLAVANDQEGLQLWDIATGRARAAANDQLQRCFPLGFAPGGKLLVTSDHNPGGGIRPAGAGSRIWDIDTGREVMTLGGTGPVTFSPDGRLLAVGSAYTVVTVWDVAAQPERVRRLDWDKPVLGLDYAPDGETLVAASGSEGGFPLRTFTEVVLVDLAGGRRRATLCPLQADVPVSCVFLDGRTLALSTGASVQLLDGGGRVRDTLPLRGVTHLMAVANDLVVLDRQGGRTWDLARRQAGPGFELKEPGVTVAVLVPPDGKAVALGCADGSVRLWDRDTGGLKVLHRVLGKPVTNLAFDPHGRSLVTLYAGENSAVLWGLEGGTATFLRGHAGPVTSVAYSPDGSALVTGGADRTLKFWDPQTGQVRATLQHHAFPVTGLAFSPDGESLTSGSGGTVGGELIVWQTARPGRERATVRGLWPLLGEGLQLRVEGGALVGLTRRGGKRWDLATGQELDPPPAPPPGTPRFGPVETVKGPDGRVRGALVERGRSSDGRTKLSELRPVSGVPSELVRTYKDLETGKERTLFTLSGYRWLAASPDGLLLAVAAGRTEAKLLDAATGAVRRELQGGGAGLERGTFSPDGRFFAAVGNDGGLVLWDVAGGKERARVPGVSGSQRGNPCFSPDGRRLAAVTGPAGTVVVVDTETGQAQPLGPEKETGGVTALTFGADGRALALGRGGEIAVWDAVERKELKRFVAKALSIHQLVAVPGPPQVLFALDISSRSVKAWDPASGKELAELNPDGTRVALLLPSPDGRHLAGQVFPSGCKVWDAVRLEGRGVLPGGSGGMMTVCFTRDGKRLFARSNSGISTWDLATAQESGFLKWETFAVPEGLAASEDGRGLLLTRSRLAEAAGEVELLVRTGDEPEIVLKHRGPVQAAVLSGDGRLAAAAGGEGVVRLWDATSGTALAAFEGHGGTVRALAFSPDGRLLASAGQDGDVRLWDVVNRKAGAVLRGHAGTVGALAFSPDGRLLASGGGDLVLRVWDVAAGRELAALRGHAGPVEWVAFAADGRYLVSRGFDGTAKVWDRPGPTAAPPAAPEEPEPAPPAPVALAPGGDAFVRGRPDGSLQVTHTATGRTDTLPGHPGARVSALALAPDGRTLASAGGDGTVRLWDLGTGKERAALRAGPQPVRCLAFSPDGTTLAAGAGGSLNLFRSPGPGEVRLWDAAPGRERAVLPGPAGVRCLAFSPDGRSLAAGGDDAAVRLWDLGEARVRFVLRHTSPVRAVAFTPDGKRLAATGYLPVGGPGPGGEKLALVWDAASGEERLAVGLRGPRPGGAAAWSLAFSADSRTLACGLEDGSVSVWDFTTRDPLLRLWGGAAPLTQVAFAPDGRVLTADLGGDVRAWGLGPPDGRQLFRAAAGRQFSALAAAPGGRALFLSGRTGQTIEVTVLDADTGAERLTFSVGRAPPGPEVPGGALLAASPDGKTVATVVPTGGPGASTVRLWDAETGRERAALAGHTAFIRALAFSADGRLLATASDDGVLKVWDAPEGKERLTLAGPRGPTRALAFVADGSFLVAVGPDQKARVWDTKEGKERQTLAAAAPLAPSPDGKWLLVGEPGQAPRPGEPAGLRAWRVDPSGDGPVLRDPVTPPASSFGPAAVWADGGTVVTGRVFEGVTLSFRPVPPGRPRAELYRPWWGTALAADGRGVFVLHHLHEVGSWAPALTVFDAGGKSQEARTGGVVAGPPGVTPALSFSARTLLTAGRDPDRPDRPGPVQVWDLADGNPNPSTKKARRSLGGTRGLIFAAALSADGRRAAVAGEERTVWLFDAASGDLLRSLECPGAVTALAFGPEGLLTAGCGDGTVLAWDGAGERRWARRAGPAEVTALAFGPGGRALAVASKDGGVRLWDTADGQERFLWRGHGAAVAALAFAPDGARLAAGGADGTVRLWETATGRAATELTGHRGPVRALLFSADGRKLAGGGPEGGLLWDLESGRGAALAGAANGGVLALGAAEEGPGWWLLASRTLSVRRTALVHRWDAGLGVPRATFPAPVEGTRDGTSGR